MKEIIYSDKVKKCTDRFILKFCFRQKFQNVE